MSATDDLRAIRKHLAQGGLAGQMRRLVDVLIAERNDAPAKPADDDAADEPRCLDVFAVGGQDALSCERFAGHRGMHWANDPAPHYASGGYLVIGAAGSATNGHQAGDEVTVIPMGADDGAGKGSTAAKTGHESDAQPAEAPGEGRSEIGPQKGVQSLGDGPRPPESQLGRWIRALNVAPAARDERALLAAFADDIDADYTRVATEHDALTTERDEARAALKDLAGEHEDVTDELLALDDRAEKAEAERDEARAVLEHGNEALRASGLTVNGMAFVYPLGDAIAALAAERDKARAEVESLQRAAQVTDASWREHVKRADRAEAAVARVRKIHRHRTSRDGRTDWCESCEDGPWPCATVTALDGVDAGGEA